MAFIASKKGAAAAASLETGDSNAMDTTAG